VHHRDALRHTRVEKPNGFDIHEIQLLQIQSYSWSGTLDLSLQLIKVLSSNLTAEANPRSVFTGNRLNFQRHWISESEAHSCECNEWAIHHSLKRCALELPLVLNFEEFLFAEENAVD
jgi:hypothetical protein